MSTLDVLGGAWVIACCAGLGAIFLIAYRDPSRNRLTRFVEWYLSRTYVRAVRIDPRAQMLAIAVLCFGLALAGAVIMAVALLQQ